MKALNIRISLLAAVVALFCGCENEEPEMSVKRFSDQHTIQASFDFSETRVFLEEQDNSFDLLAKWLANDHIKVFYNVGEKYVGTDPIVVAEVTPDGLGAKFQYTVPSTWGKHDTYDIKIFTVSCFPATKDDKLYFNASIIRQPLELFQVPVYSEGEVNEYGVLNATFHHYYTYELLHISNTSDSDIEFSLIGFEGTPWYKEKGSICIDDGLFVIDAPSTRDPKRESTPITIKPGETRTIVSAYVPNGTIHQATMVAKINGEYVHSSNTKSSGIELKQGHAYHMYAGWDGEELEFWNNADEPLNVETLSAEVNPKTLIGAFTGTVTNSSIEGLKSGFLFLKEGNHPEDYVEYDSTFSNGDTFGLTLSFDDFVTIAGDAPVKGTYNVSAYVFDEKGNRFHGKMLQFTIDNDQPESMVPVPEPIDLGLPSGVKWASFNLGAAKPEDYGYYYAWGEIEPKETFSWGTYKWCNGSDRSLTKYNTDSSYGTVDNKIILDPEDDAAFMNLGGKWRMPTKAEQDELINNCNIVSTQVNGVQGKLFTSRINGNSVFIPANGYYHSPGSSGEYWSSSLWVGRPFDAYDLDFTQSLHLENGGRYESRGIRPVYDDKTITSIITNTPTNINSCSVEIPFTISTSETIRGIGIVYSTNNSAPETGDYGDGSYLVYSTSDICNSMIVNSLKPNTTYYARPFMVLSDGTELYGNTIQFTTKGLSYSTEYVDLGLSVKWATCNLGSSSPHEVGAFYAWGETEPAILRQSYKWSGAGGFTKYNADDGKVTLDATDDAASVNLGGKWRMPTNEEINELRNYCTWTPATSNGVQGCKVTGENGNSIFIPVSKGFSGYFDVIALSSSLNTYYEGYQYVHALLFDYDENRIGYLSTFRDGWNPIRPVYDESGQKPDNKTPEVVDLGLPSGLKWASFNLGASKPEEYGDYYAWGETETKDDFSWGTYKWCNGDYLHLRFFKYCPVDQTRFWGDSGMPDGIIALNTDDDAAHVNLGGNWRMSSDVEWTELREKCTWTWTTHNGVNGYTVTGPSGNSIFLPAAGYGSGTNLLNAGACSYYWSLSLDSGQPNFGRFLFFHSGTVYQDSSYRYYGFSIRPVYDD